MNILIFAPYLSEGLPLNILEAMASGKPVVASNIGANCELVVDGVTGFLPAPKRWAMETDYLDATLLADKVEYLLRNKELAKKMGKAGRKIVEEKFSAEAVARKHESLYRELLGR